MGNDHRTVIFGNGRLEESFLKQLRPNDFIISVDRAAYWLLTHNILPDVAIGDFDSTTPAQVRLIKKSIKVIKHYPSEKNFTDMELAIQFAKGEVIIFGATGTRLDHTIATLHMLGNHTLVDEHNRIRLIGRGKTIIDKASYRYLSILPYTKSITLSLTGFRYDLNCKILKKGTSLGVSNEITGRQAVIELFAGKAWVIESND